MAGWRPALLGQGLPRGPVQGQSGTVVPLGHWQQLLETTSLAKAMTFCNAFSTKKKVLRRSLAVLGWAALPARFPVALGSPYPVTEQLGDSADFSLPFYFLSALQVTFASDYLWWFVSHV